MESLLFGKLAIEMAFNIFAAQRVSCPGQYHRIDDFIARKLRGYKSPVPRQFLVDKFHFPAVFKGFDPFFIRHFLTFSGGLRVCREYTLLRGRNRRPELRKWIIGNLKSQVRLRRCSGRRVSSADAIRLDQ
jgi:hypothetical protein